MNPLRKAYCRTFQLCFRAALPVLPYYEPTILDSLDALPGLLAQKDIGRVLIVTDKGLRAAGLIDPLAAALEAAHIEPVIYDETVANPTVKNAEDAAALYRAKGCGAIIGFGGGSPMDCAKAVGALIARPRKNLRRMRGLLRVLRPLPLLIAVPTTAGTGSEVTLAAVITDAERHHKYVMNDFFLIPRYAVHDYRVTLGLPPQVTATTGMDALTHAIEAYIGRSTNAYTRANAEEACRLIHGNLLRAYRDGEDAEARRSMLAASYKAGVAFTRSYVGYVHGIAHSLGGQYGVPHGLANAVILPHVLRAYGASCQPKLARLARIMGITDERAQDGAAASALIAWINQMNEEMGIPRHLDCIQRADIPAMAAHCDAECNPLYPVPTLWNRDELAHLYEVVAGWQTAEDTAGGRTGAADRKQMNITAKVGA